MKKKSLVNIVGILIIEAVESVNDFAQRLKRIYYIIRGFKECEDYTLYSYSLLRKYRRIKKNELSLLT